MWQTIESKSRTIEDFRKGNLAIRNFDDVSSGAATAAEMKAIASGNPLILSEIRLAQVEKKYMALEKSFKQKKFRMEDELMRLRKDPPSVKLQNFYARRKVILDQLPKDTKLNDKGQPAVELYVRGEVMPADSKEHVAKLREHFASVLGNCLDDRQDFADSGNAYLLGSYRGFRLIAQRRCLIADGFRILMEHEKTGVKFAPDNLFYYKKEFESINLQGFYQRVNNFIDKKMYEQFDFIESNFKSDQEKLEQLEIDVKASFRYAADLRIARLNHQNVIAQLELMKSDPGYVPDWHPYKMPNSADSLDDAVSLPPEVFDEVFEARVDFEAGKKQEEAVHYFTEGQQTLIDLPPAAEPQNKQEPQDKQEEEQTDLQREELLNSHSHLKPCGQEDFDGAAENLRRELRNAFPGEKFSVTADNRNRYEKGLKIRFANPLIAAEIADHAFKFRDGDKTDFQKVFGQVPYLDLDFDPAKFEKEVTLADKTGKALSYDSPEDYVIVDYNCTPKLFFFDSDEAKSVGIRPLLDWKGKNEASLLNNHIIPQYWKFPRHLITDGTLDRFVDEKKMVASPRVFVTCADIARERKISIADVRAQMQENENTRKAAAMRVA